MRLRFQQYFWALIALTIVGPSLRAQDGLREALPESGNVQPLLHGILLGNALVAADFDNDQRPDGAMLLDAGQCEGHRLFRVKLHLTLSQQSDLSFQSTETGLAISALDVNRDGAPDLVVEQLLTRKRLRVWLNDGHGKFRPARVEDFPPATESPCRWESRPEKQIGLVLGLPSRTGVHYAGKTVEGMRYDLSSPQWRVLSETPAFRKDSLALHSPRSPPAWQSL